MSSSPALPSCPKCGRRIAAWKMDHCVYCGFAFPAGFKEGVPEPESLKWIERPEIPPDAAKKLEMMKVVPLDREQRPRSWAKVAALLSIPIFAVIFYLLHAIVYRQSPATAVLILVGGMVFVGYLVWSAFRSTQG